MESVSYTHLDVYKRQTLHYAYAYLARDFDLTQYPLQGLTSLESPSLKTIKKAIDFSEYNHISTVFYEYGQNPKQAAALAEEIGLSLIHI